MQELIVLIDGIYLCRRNWSASFTEKNTPHDNVIITVTAAAIFPFNVFILN